MGTQQHCVVCQKWMESERGWGIRPDGYTLHLTMDDCRRFREEYWTTQHARDGGSVPDEYSFEAGEPFMVQVDSATHKQLMSRKKDPEMTPMEKAGVWECGSPPS